MKDIDVLIVDDHKLFADTIKSWLNRCKGISVTEILHSAKGLFNYLNSIDEYPNIVLLDIKLPDSNGLEVLKKLRREYPKIKCIMVSMIDDEAIILETIKYGASSYLNKSSEPTELVQAIKDVQKKGAFVSIEMTKAMRASMQDIQDSKNYPVDEELTQIEKQVVVLLCEEKSNKEIAEHIHRSVRSVENIRKRITDKIGAKNVVGIVKYGYEKGLYKPSPRI